MNACERLRGRIHLYLDGEMSPAESMEMEEHLLACGRCREMYRDLRAVVDAVRGARPLYEVPGGLEQKARAVVARHDRGRQWRAAAIALVALGAIWVIWLPADDFTAFAADSHLRHASGAMPLDIASADPGEVSRWLGARLAFPMSLPNYPEGAERKRYQLSGARLLQYRNRDVAYLAYQMDGKPISLLMTSEGSGAAAGGRVYRSGNLSFHFFERKGLSVIAWTDHGIHYSLVSGFAAQRGESCIICHGKAGEQRMIEGLTPDRPAQTTDTLRATPAASVMWR